ncbi:hypothetical protein [Methanococcoides seepicolus]|uniref:Uncharacterized protein n=1 Tax=Methanococcoides seepicolus TaxID=2828780 RepID=A0A9E4ZFK8_9EURY|nr:hypothetical protein [Methanococcoides seepicolus]MCM1987003.1 hypothetical protein [Methanococcoides seepicolus]
MVDWITEKANKNVFSMWFLLSTRLKNVSVASWTCETFSDKLSLLNLQLGDKNYFTVGYGSSNTQARKDAGNKMLIEASIFEWADKNYPDYRI